MISDAWRGNKNGEKHSRAAFCLMKKGIALMIKSKKIIAAALLAALLLAACTFPAMAAQQSVAFDPNTKEAASYIQLTINDRSRIGSDTPFFTSAILSRGMRIDANGSLLVKFYNKDGKEGSSTYGPPIAVSRGPLVIFIAKNGQTIIIRDGTAGEKTLALKSDGHDPDSIYRNMDQPTETTVTFDVVDGVDVKLVDALPALDAGRRNNTPTTTAVPPTTAQDPQDQTEQPGKPGAGFSNNDAGAEALQEILNRLDSLDRKLGGLWAFIVVSALLIIMLLIVLILLLLLFFRLPAYLSHKYNDEKEPKNKVLRFWASWFRTRQVSQPVVDEEKLKQENADLEEQIAVHDAYVAELEGKLTKLKRTIPESAKAVLDTRGSVAVDAAPMQRNAQLKALLMALVNHIAALENDVIAGFVARTSDLTNKLEALGRAVPENPKPLSSALEIFYAASNPEQRKAKWSALIKEFDAFVLALWKILQEKPFHEALEEAYRTGSAEPLSRYGFQFSFANVRDPIEADLTKKLFLSEQADPQTAYYLIESDSLYLNPVKFRLRTYETENYLNTAFIQGCFDCEGVKEFEPSPLKENAASAVQVDDSSWLLKEKGQLR